MNTSSINIESVVSCSIPERLSEGQVEKLVEMISAELSNYYENRPERFFEVDLKLTVNDISFTAKNVTTYAVVDWSLDGTINNVAFDETENSKFPLAVDIKAVNAAKKASMGDIAADAMATVIAGTAGKAILNIGNTQQRLKTGPCVINAMSSDLKNAIANCLSASDRATGLEQKNVVKFLVLWGTLIGLPVGIASGSFAGLTGRQGSIIPNIIVGSALLSIVATISATTGLISTVPNDTLESGEGQRLMGFVGIKSPKLLRFSMLATCLASAAVLIWLTLNIRTWD